jgi:hypothetical protein
MIAKSSLESAVESAGAALTSSAVIVPQLSLKILQLSSRPQPLRTMSGMITSTIILFIIGPPVER